MKRMKNISEEVSLGKKIFTLRDLLGMFHTIENSKDRMLEAHPNFERSITICQGIEKYSFHTASYMIRRRQALFKPSLIRFVKRNKILKLLMF